MTYELTVQRVLDAPPAAVFEAFTDEEAMREWYRGPDDPPDAIVEVTCDPRVGGRGSPRGVTARDGLPRDQRVHRRRPATTARHDVEHRPPDGRTLDTEVEITFEEYGDGTRVTVVQRGFPDAEVRDYFATYAWAVAFDRIAHYLEKEKS